MKDKRIDEYILKAARFAQPILIHVRNMVHTACAVVEEIIKWGMPFMNYKDPLCNMVAFKAHCSFGFWKAALMHDSGELSKNPNIARGI